MLTSFEQAELEGYTTNLPDSFRSANVTYERAPVRGLQYFSAVPDEDIVGESAEKNLS